jgi:cell division transport system ATP-binding protein
MIQFQNVLKSYKFNDFKLGELTFKIDPGEFVFLIGPSGSGKTTVIKLLTREEHPTSGKIYFDDFDITRLSQSSTYKLRRQIGVIFQDYKLIPDKNVYENVAFAMEVAGRSNREIKETVPYLLDIVGLSHRSTAFPNYLSGGEKQRVAIARAVANNPKILIADEPTGNLDPGAAWDIVQILSKINNWGTTVIMSTHGSDIVNTLNKRVIQMHGGKIIRDDSRGGYEITSSVIQTSSGISDLLATPEQKSGPIKVRLRTERQNSKPQTKESKGLFSWLWGRETESKILDPHSMGVHAAIEDQPLDLELPEKDMKRIIKEANETELSELALPKEVVADLETAGYKDVEDVITAGPEKLDSEAVIDDREVIQIAQAVEKFVAETEMQIQDVQPEQPAETKEENKEEPKPETKAEPETETKHQQEDHDDHKRVSVKPKDGKVKINLTGKKK